VARNQKEKEGCRIQNVKKSAVVCNEACGKKRERHCASLNSGSCKNASDRADAC